MIETHPLAKCCWCGSAFVKAPLTLGKAAPIEAWICPQRACYLRQTRRAMVVDLKGKGTVCRFVPLPRQVEAMDAVDGPATFVMFGGARGGSKSKAMREIAHARCMATPHYRVLLLRRTFRELEDNHLINMEMEAPTLGADFVPSAKLLRYPNRSTLRFGHCETSADASNYLSSEYDLIIFDELVTFEQQQFLLIATSARSTKAGVQPKVISGTNPGGPQSYWVRARFIDKTVDLAEFPDYRPEDYVFIPSKLEDNPYLDKNYEKKLLALPPALREAYRNGDWDIFPGQYFPEWRKRTHVSHDARTGEPIHLVYPPDYKRVLFMDYGYVKPGYVGWMVLLPEGQAYWEDEYVPERVAPFDQGKRIAELSVARGVRRIAYLVFDTQMETPNADTGEPIIETVLRGMRAGGLSVAPKKADKERKNGWARCRAWLKPSPDAPGTPWLRVSPHCPYAIRTIPSLISDENDPEDVDTDGEDHAADAWRYWAMSRPWPGATRQTPKAKEWSLGWLKGRQTTTLGMLGSRGVKVA